MNRIYLSTYGIAFSDYETLKRQVDAFPDFQLGVEYATEWKTPDFHERLTAQITDMAGIPATIHAPFVEICTVPGSEEEAYMEACFDKACWYYQQFHATSMVIHTNEGSFPEEERSAKRARTKEVLLRWYEKLRKMGIEMTVENVGYPLKDNLLFDYDEFVRLFAELPDEIGCLIDTGHAMLNGWDIVKLIKTLGPRIRGYHLNNNDGKHDSHYPLYDSEGYYSPQQIDEMLRAIAIYSPDADLGIEYAPDGRFTTESLYADIRRVVRVTEEAASQTRRV